MKLIAVIFLSVLVLTVNIHGGLHLLVYEISKPTLTEAYCANKAAYSSCEAKCHISKVLKESESSQKEDGNLPAPELDFKIISFIHQTDKIQNAFSKESVSIYCDLSEFYSFILAKVLFHPPNNLG